MKLTEEQILERINDCEQSIPETEWRKSADEDYKFYAGDQDTVEVAEKLIAQKRPNTVFNEIKPKVDMLIGIAAQSRTDGTILPVGVEDEPLTELMNGVHKHYRKKLKMKTKEQDCFSHVTKAGRSMLYFWVDRSNPFKPLPQTKRIPGWQFGIDPDSTELDLSDARYMYVDKWVTEEEYFELVPDAENGVSQYHLNIAGQPEFYNQHNRKYRLVEFWYKSKEKVVYFISPMSGKDEWLFPKGFKLFRQQLLEGIKMPGGGLLQIKDPAELPGISSKIDVYRYAILGGHGIIEENTSPYLKDGIDRVQYPGVLYAGYRDDNTNALFGAIKMAKDPQRALNTIRRQLVHLLQTLPKGILVHEAGAILNVEEYEDRGSEPNFHLELAQGGLTRYKFEQQPSISPLYGQLDLTFGQSIKDVSGIQDDLMGKQQSSREAGVSVQLRQQSGLVVIYILFDNYQNARIQGNQKLLAMIQQYVSYETAVRIEGEKGVFLTQINSQMNPQNEGFNDIRSGEFDFTIDEVDESPTIRMQIAQVLTDLNHNNPGMIPPDIILEYTNAPFTVKQRVREAYQAMMEAEEARKDAEVEAKMISAKHKSQTGGK